MPIKSAREVDQTTRSDLTWRLCLPAGREFTLAFMKPWKEGSSSSYSVCEREMHIKLPALATDTMGECHVS